jgi:hypothetical protein
VRRLGRAAASTSGDDEAIQGVQRVVERQHGRPRNTMNLTRK